MTLRFVSGRPVKLKYPAIWGFAPRRDKYSLALDRFGGSIGGVTDYNMRLKCAQGYLFRAITLLPLQGPLQKILDEGMIPPYELTCPGPIRYDHLTRFDTLD